MKNPRSMQRTVAALTVAIALGASTAQAAEPLIPPPPDYRPTWNPQPPSWDTPTQAAVRMCIDYVKRTSSANSRFDAYVADHRIHWFGTKEQTFQFNKCLAAHGL